jgi:membrane associated rhomboid family serine protease
MIIPFGDINPRRRFPWVNYGLIAANVGVFIALFFRPEYQRIVDQYGLIPTEFRFRDLFTSAFLHGDPFHLLGNMLYLWIVGDNVEDRLGHPGYLMFYLLSAAAAGFVHMGFNMGSRIPTIGASGAVSGVLGAYALLFPLSRIKFLFVFWFLFFVRIDTIYLPAVVAIGFWFLLQLLLGFMVASRPMMGGVAYWAHIGGFLFGVILVLLARQMGLVSRARRR